MLPVPLRVTFSRSGTSRVQLQPTRFTRWEITTDIKHVLPARCNKSFLFANSETETCLESCIIHFPTRQPCSTMVDVLETNDVPLQETKTHAQLLACFLLQLSIPHRDMLCWAENDKPLVRPTKRRNRMKKDAIKPSTTKTLGTTNIAGSNCSTGTRGVKGLTRASRGDLDFGHKGTE